MCGTMKVRRWFHLLELLTSQGWPVSEAHVAACGGVACNFSRAGRVVNPQRSHASMSGQCGNAMHVNSIGAILFSCFCLCPLLSDSLGTEAAEAANAVHVQPNARDVDIAVAFASSASSAFASSCTAVSEASSQPQGHGILQSFATSVARLRAAKLCRLSDSLITQHLRKPNTLP